MNFWVNYTLNNKGRRTISACKEFKHKTITASPKGSAQVRNRPDCTKVFKSSSKMTHTHSLYSWFMREQIRHLEPL